MLQITVSEFYRMSPKEFYYALKVKRESEIQKLEFEFKRDYEVARFHALLVINPTLEKGKQLKSPRQLVSFAWEKEEVEEKQSMEQMKSLLMGIARSGKNKNKK